MTVDFASLAGLALTAFGIGSGKPGVVVTGFVLMLIEYSNTVPQ